MKIFFSILVVALLTNSATWLTNINTAKQIAQKENKYIILNFSGSDWCGPCIRMHDEIFNSKVFSQYADSNLILVNADFPRAGKNQLPAVQQKLNDSTADKYNPTGIFPYTLLLNANGNVLKKWEEFYPNGAENFTDEVRQIVDTKALQK